MLVLGLSALGLEGRSALAQPALMPLMPTVQDADAEL